MLFKFQSIIDKFQFLLVCIFLLMLSFGCSTVQKIAKQEGACKKQAQHAAINKLVGVEKKSDYKVLNTKYYGLGVEKLGSLRLHLYSVEIADEADGGVMIAFVDEKNCRVHDILFGTHALPR